MKYYLVKRRLYKGNGEYTTENEVIQMADHEASPLVASGAIAEQIETKEEPKGRVKK